jgi:hypothetical protein
MNVHTVGIALGKTAFQHDRIGSTGKYCDEGAPHAEPTTPAILQYAGIPHRYGGMLSRTSRWHGADRVRA